MTLKYIFSKPEFIEGIGEIHPVKLKEYDEFVEVSTPLYYRKEHFQVTDDRVSLLDILCFEVKEENFILSLEKLFSMVLKKEVKFINDEHYYLFYIDDNHLIHSGNYEQIREVIMKQNLMHEQKVYKDPLVAQWANKVIQARAKNSIKLELEDKISTVSAFTGKHYWDLAEYTYYQLETDFNRINKFKGYDTSILFRSVGAETPLDHYAENLDMFKSPYDDIFKSKDKLKKLDNAMK